MAKKRLTLRKKQDFQDKYIIRMQGGKTGLVEATSKMDIHEFRVFMTMLTMVLPEDEDFIEYEIRTQDIIKLYSLSDDGRYYEAIREAAERLFNKKFIIFEKKEDGEIYKTTIHLIDETSEPVNESEQNRIRLKFNPKLKPYLLQLQKEYLTIDVRNIANIASPNSVKLYLILKHQYNLGNRKVKYTVSRLKEILAISEDEYPLYGNFKQKIIQKGIKDLDKHTDLAVIKLDEEKAGRAIDAVIFYLSEKKAPRQVEIMTKKLSRQVIKSSNGSVVVSTHTHEENKLIQPIQVVEAEIIETMPHNTQKDFDELFDKIRKYKIAKSTLKKWLDELPLEQIQLGIAYVLDRIKEGEKIKNIGGYMNNMVRTNSLFEDKQEEKKQKDVKKQQANQERQTKLDQENFEKRKNEVRQNYYDAKRNFMLTKISETETLATKLFESLNQEIESSKPTFIAQLAWEKYKELKVEGSEKDKLLFAIDKSGFSFYSYVSDWFQGQFPEQIEEIKRVHQIRADELNINLE